MNPTWKNRLHRGLRVLRPALPYLPALLVTGWIAHKSISGILDHVGHPAVPLDDAFIHFQFARNLANGQFFHYAPGQGYVAGATSLLWPLVLAPFFLLGFNDLSIVWIVWILGFAAFAALMLEVYRLAEKLTGPAVALSASAMCALFGGFIWFAASGMETLPLAWILVRTGRVAAQWMEAERGDRTRKLRNELVLLGVLAPLIRPEGALASVIAAVAIFAFSLSRERRERLRAAVPLAGPLIMPAIHLVMTGSPSSNTTAVKWLPLNPYFHSPGALWETVGPNLRLMFSTLLDGQQWSAVFVPEGALPFALMGLIAIPVAGWRTRRPWRALIVLFLALGMFVPCTYHTFLWNRLRYLWPFLPAWFIGVACFARLLGDVLGLVRPRWAVMAPVLGGVAAGTLVGNLKWTLSDLTKSAAAIDLQQVTLGRWAKDNLPENAIIGVNDTGAIAYFSDRPTFDVIGLTTQGEAKHWVAGSGSRFEHYERLVAETPNRFPTHFIVYPNWMQCEPVLGKQLHEASVYDQTILGGTTMVVYEARLDLLGSGARPIEQPLTGELVDEVDVADLVSEAEHAYEIEHGSGNELSNTVHTDFVFHQEEETGGEDGRRWADGGRFRRSADRFVAHLRPGKRTLGVARWVGPDSGEVEIVVESGAHVLTTVRLAAHRAQEVSFTLPGDLAKEQTPIQVRALHGGHFGSLHYWFVVDER